MNEDLAALTALAKGKRTPAIVLAVVCCVIAMLGWLDPSASLALKLGLSIPFGLIAAVMVFLAVRPAHHHPVIVVLRDRPGDVASLRIVKQTVNGRHSQSFLELTLKDGTKRALALGTGGDEARWLACASRLAPGASRSQ